MVRTDRFFKILVGNRDGRGYLFSSGIIAMQKIMCELYVVQLASYCTQSICTWLTDRKDSDMCTAQVSLLYTSVTVHTPGLYSTHLQAQLLLGEGVRGGVSLTSELKSFMIYKYIIREIPDTPDPRLCMRSHVLVFETMHLNNLAKSKREKCFLTS